MTETSWWWNGHTTGDAAVNAPYTMDQWATIYDIMFIADPENQGVIGGTLDSLEVTSISASFVSIGAGAAIVNGKLYYNDAPISLGISGASVYCLIGLAVDTNAQTVRAFQRGGYTDQSTALLSLIHDTTYWEIPLAVVFTTSSGTVSSIDDLRLFAIRPQKRNEFIPATGCFNYTDTTDVIAYDARGYPMEDNHLFYCYGNMIVPNNYWKMLTVKAVLISANAGNLYSQLYVEYGSLNDATEAYNKHLSSTGWEVTAVSAGFVENVNETQEINNLKSGTDEISDFLSFTFARDSISTPGGALDTITGTVYFCGFLVEYMTLF